MSCGQYTVCQGLQHLGSWPYSSCADTSCMLLIFITQPQLLVKKKTPVHYLPLFLLTNNKSLYIS